MILLGSTGSIGVNTLNIAREFNLNVETLVAGKNTKLLQEQINEFHPTNVVVAGKEQAQEIRHDNIFYGEEGILEAIEISKSDTVVNALVGFLGLKPTITAQRKGKKIALANKESLVSGGKFIDTSNITPIDSEHFALMYLLSEKRAKKMTITASGGAFRDWEIEKIAEATLEDTQKHPNWAMGQKITIDSASMVNKIFEVLEGYWLFKDRFEEKVAIDAFIETKSLIHGLIDFADGNTTAHIANADMRLPIAYALLEKVDKQILKPIDFTKVGSLEFREIEADRYPVWEIKDALLENPDMGVVVNAANEAGIAKFLEGKTNFAGISKTILEAYKRYEGLNLTSLEDVFTIDTEVRKSFS